MRAIKRAAAFLVLTLATAAAPASTAPEVQGQSTARAHVTTRHTGTFNGKKIRYTAAVESIDVADDKGRPSARMVTFTYVADSKREQAQRPVIFVFNGGPITASLWLHIGVMGPKRVAVPEDLTADASAYALVDNPYSPLDVADLVFVDPASTGYSRVLSGVAPESYFSVVADGQQVAAFIAAWLTAHDRLASPVFLVGESYGTLRAAEVAGQLAELPKPILTEGVVLMGQAINIIEYSQRPQNIISYVVSLPTLAALGWYHGKVDRKGRTLEQFVDQAWQFAQSDYLSALFQGGAIDVAQRDRIAQRLEEWSGIPAAYYREHNLKITKQQYRAELLKDRGLLLGTSDGRYVAPMTDKGLADDPSAIIMEPFKRLFADYVRKDLKVDWPAEYLVGVPAIKGLDDWDWGGTTPFSDWPYGNRMEPVMKANPRFRVLIGNGYYDTQTTVGAAQLAVRQAGWPAGRASLSFYEGGHLAYTVEQSAKKFTDDIRVLVQAAP